MSVIKVAILGFGTVGEGVYRTIHSHAEELQTVLGKKVEVAAILIQNKQKERDIAEDVLITSDFDEILKLQELDVVVEAIVGKEPAFSFLKKAIEKGCHIVTANKEMFAHHGKELQILAEEHNVSIGFEATVAGGIPIIQTIRQLLKINRVHQIQGILNGTSNFILTEMREKKQSFAEALLLAQVNGFAEADPTNDVEGFDAFFKTMILSRIAFGDEPVWNDVELEGITSISNELIEAAENYGLRFKHIARISKEDGQIKAIIKPALVDQSHPFYHVEGVQNAVNVHSNIVGDITLQGPGAGMFPTASAAIEDLVYVCQNAPSQKSLDKSSAFKIEEKKKEVKEYWLVHGVKDKLLHPGITWIDQTSSGTYIIKAEKKDVEHLALQQKPLCYFSILGNSEMINKQSLAI
ncbi:homoserine dehydrogenase [Bacillus sp. EB106-08-02-XG196]|uniref:homoserine dehydrogenase n=1 Tax=Bacillus sp. EB106-08-02-XG196 TaxID=2737049 RepID=UPI0015C451E8|nr:homoserine dehydrogenase [Bacillus sp. EB106-08-02-XG196]NWQ44438.1 homoserine dehydrogenase [Bacillus sp. EB106-08-02-XG196]